VKISAGGMAAMAMASASAIGAYQASAMARPSGIESEKSKIIMASKAAKISAESIEKQRRKRLAKKSACVRRDREWRLAASKAWHQRKA
jgi:hypothetical protein